MNHLLRSIVFKLGVDKAIAYSSGARIIQAFTGFVSIFFVSRYLTGVEQGFYYTFGSLVAIQTFFELGLTGIITQYVAHEASHLEVTSDYVFKGEIIYKSRLASLLHFSVKWYSIISVLFLLVILVVGFVFFSHYSSCKENVSWKIPWILISIGTAIKLFQSPLSSFFMGLGLVKEMNKIGFYQQLVLPLSVWLGLFCGFRLYVLGISSILSVLIWNIYVSRTSLQKLFFNIWKECITERVKYSKEIFPYQWRIALSWISGYFVFQLFNPILFATEGAVVAGQMGMTLAVITGIQAFSLSWLNTKVPLYSKLIALKDYVQLDTIFVRTLKQMSLICFLMLCTMLLGIWFFRVAGITLGAGLLSDRFLPIVPILLMIIPTFINQFIASWATYLRCHKQEPFMALSIVSGVACCLSTTLLGKYLGVIGVTGGYCVITMTMMPWAYWIYKMKKKEWHGK